MSRVNSEDGTYTYEPTVLNRPLKPGEKLAYESQLGYGPNFFVSRYQKSINRCADLGFDVTDIQSAFDEISPLIMTGDLTRGVPSDWHFEASGKITAIYGGNLKAMTWENRRKWQALSSLVNQSAGFHDFCSDEVDQKIEKVLLAAVTDLLNSLS